MREILLNIGSFADMFYSSDQVCIINIDDNDLEAWAGSRGYNFQRIDVRNGSPYKDNGVDIILCSHFLEHLNREEGAKFLSECFRVLKPDGLVRLVVPDSLRLAEEYAHGDIMEYRHVNVDVDNAPDSAEALFHLLLAGHQTIYDEESLRKALENSGFVNINICKPFESSSRAVELQTISMYPTLSLYIEAKKPIPHEEKGIHMTTPTTATTRVEGALKIALLSTPLLKVPPENYGGLELIVANLGQELAKLGHDVTIFAPRGSSVAGCHMVDIGEAKNTVFIDWLRAETEMYERVKAEIMTGGYDIIHGHNWFGMEYRMKAIDPRLHVLHTHHGGLLAEWWTKTRAPFKLNMCGISNWMKSVYERQGIPTRAVYNGVNLSDYPLKRKKGDRFLWMSRMAFFKAPHLAVQVAKETGIKLDLAGATQFVEDANYVAQIKQSCDGKQIRFIGEVTNEQKVELLQKAKALIVTGKWGEPFGLHVIEALSCGTPVIAVADGGITETLKEGGILCLDIDALKDAVRSFSYILPTKCRRNAIRFSSRIMAENYLKAYRDILAGNEW